MINVSNLRRPILIQSPQRRSLHHILLAAERRFTRSEWLARILLSRRPGTQDFRN